MSVRVDLAALAEQIDSFGPNAYLVTVNEDRTSHVASVLVEVGPDGNLAMGAGRSSVANVGRLPEVTLLWPPGPDGDYSLLVDGSAHELDGDPSGAVAVAPRAAVLHRVAGRATDGPTCVRVETDGPAAGEPVS